MSRRTRAFELDAGEDVAAAVAARTGAVPAGEVHVEDRVLVDTFDGRLHAAGLVAAEGEAVDPALLENRALLPVARVRSRVRDLAVLDAEEKTVVRVRVEEPEVLRGRGERVALPARVEVREVLGYGKAFDRAVAAIEDGDGGAREPDGTLLAAASRAVGRDPAGVTSKVRVAMEPGTPAGAAAAALLTRLADVCEANVPGTLDDLDVEFLHDLRVSVRRTRSVLRELKEVFPADALAHLRAELKWVQAATGPVRDLDVQIEDLEHLAAHLDDARRADLDPIRAALRERRVTELAALRATLRGRRFAAAIAAWRALEEAEVAPDAAVPSEAARPVAAVAAERIRRVYRRMVRDGSAIDDGSPAEDLHELRKRGKELRYLLELFGGLFPSEVVKPMVRSLKDLQDVLGRFQDRAVQVHLLEEVGADVARRRGGPAALMALGLVLEELRADQHRAREEFHDRFEAFAAKEQRRLVKETFTA